MTPNTEISLPQSSFPYPNSIISNHLPLNWLSLTSLSLSHIHSLIFPNFLGSKPRVLQDKADKGFCLQGKDPRSQEKLPRSSRVFQDPTLQFPQPFPRAHSAKPILGFMQITMEMVHPGDGERTYYFFNLLSWKGTFLSFKIITTDSDEGQDGIECTEFSESNREGGQWSITGIGERESREGNNTSIRSPWNYAGKKESDIQNQFESTTLLFF